MCIGLHTLPPCLLFCGNYILHESEYDVHIFCVALDIIIYRFAPATPFLSTIEVFRQSAAVHRLDARLSAYRRRMFLKQTSNSLPLSPLGHSDGFASCKAWCVLISASLPKTPFPRERLCMLGWLCIVQSLWAYTPGIRAGLSVGLPPSPSKDA